MIFIYDIWVNFNDKFYEFYEWSENDIIEHVRKMPLLRIKKEMLDELISKNIIINKIFLNNIYNKSEIFNNKNIEYLEYGCIFSDLNRAIVVTFNKEGQILELSSISVGEELEIMDITETLILKDIKYKSLNNKYEINNLTRKENKLVGGIINELEKIKTDKSKIDYLCYEWFGKTNETYDNLVDSIKKEFTEKHREFMDLLKLVV